MSYMGQFHNNFIFSGSYTTQNIHGAGQRPVYLQCNYNADSLHKCSRCGAENVKIWNCPAHKIPPTCMHVYMWSECLSSLSMTTCMLVVLTLNNDLHGILFVSLYTKGYLLLILGKPLQCFIRHTYHNQAIDSTNYAHKRLWTKN